MAWTTPATFTAGSVLTAAQLNTNVRDNTNALYGGVKFYGVQTRNTDYTAFAGAITSASSIFTDISITADGSTTYRLECHIPQISFSAVAGGYVIVDFFLGSTQQGSDFLFGIPTANSMFTTGHLVQYVTPAAGTYAVNVRAASGNGVAVTLSGATSVLSSVNVPMTLRVTGAGVA